MTNWYYKEFEINSNNATYDVLWHKTQPIPCNNSQYGNQSENINNKDVWCQDTTYDNNGNWTMLNQFDGDTNSNGLKTATSIQYKSQNDTICNLPCNQCPNQTPSAWCPWTQLSKECNEWPHQRTESWTIEIRMPIKQKYDTNLGKIVFNGLLDTDNQDLNARFVEKCDPNSFQNLSEHILFWSIDFGRTEHPIGYNQNNEWTTVKNESVLNNVLSVYPTLLGVYSYNNYWEWTWQSVGITKYMHYPEYWGLLRFIDDENERYKCQNIEFPARHLLYSLWWSNFEYFLSVNGTKYANDVKELVNEQFCKPFYCDLNALEQAVYAKDSCYDFEIVIDAQSGCVNFMDGLSLEQQLYSGICYHLSVHVNVDGNSHNALTINITESHEVSVQKQNYNLCL